MHESVSIYMYLRILMYSIWYEYIFVVQLNFMYFIPSIGGEACRIAIK
jgi:hypothetical protein